MRTARSSRRPRGASPPGKPLEQTPPPGADPPGAAIPPIPVDRLTGACESITLPQLRCGR